MTGWEEILFENRNKMYGAYMLRKKSRKYKLLGLLFSILFIFIASATLFVIFNSDLFFSEKLPLNNNVEVLELVDLQDFKFPEPPPKSQEKASPDFTQIKMVDSTLEEKKKLEAPKKTTTNIDTITKKGSETPEDGLETSPKGDNFNLSGKHAEFIGGMAELAKFLRNNLKETALKYKVKLNVIVVFTVTKTGDVRDVVIISGNNPEINKDVVRVIGMLPKWRPAQHDGRTYDSRVSLPISL